MNMCPVELSDQSDHVILIEGAEGGTVGLIRAGTILDFLTLTHYETIKFQTLLRGKYKAVCSEQQRLS